MRTKPADQPALLASVLLQLRGQHATSRSNLAKITGLSPSTVGLYVDHLIALGYVSESGLEQGPMGRPKRKLSLVAQAGWFAGVEFNAERIQAVRVDFSGNMIASLVSPLPEKATTQPVLDMIKRAVIELGQRAPGKMLAMGVGVPGLVDPASGVALQYAFIPDWKKVPLVKTLQEHFSVKVTLENNLRAIALAERWFGGGRQLDDYVILGPRSGFGIAIVKNGRLIHGAHHATGEVGHWPWPLSSSQGEVHDELTAPAVWHRLTGAAKNTRLPKDLHAAIQSHADDCGDTWQKIIADYARVIGLMHLLLDADTYFLHGPLTALGKRFCQEIADHACLLMPVFKEIPLKIKPSDLGDNAGALGAASLAMEAWVPDLTDDQVS